MNPTDPSLPLDPGARRAGALPRDARARTTAPASARTPAGLARAVGLAVGLSLAASAVAGTVAGFAVVSIFPVVVAPVQAPAMRVRPAAPPRELVRPDVGCPLAPVPAAG